VAYDPLSLGNLIGPDRRPPKRDPLSSSNLIGDPEPGRGRGISHDPLSLSNLLGPGGPDRELDDHPEYGDAPSDG
jgi:hypothetical protein